jgi:hypothetical protein
MYLEAQKETGTLQSTKNTPGNRYANSAICSL